MALLLAWLPLLAAVTPAFAGTSPPATQAPPQQPSCHSAGPGENTPLSAQCPACDQASPLCDCCDHAVPTFPVVACSRFEPLPAKRTGYLPGALQNGPEPPLARQLRPPGS